MGILSFKDMKQSGRKEIDGRRFAEIFNLQGNNAMQSKLYAAAIDCYKAATWWAAAYIQTCQYAEAILDCKKSIAIDPNYIEAYIHLGYIYFGLGIDAALEKGYIATHLDPTNESVREGVRVSSSLSLTLSSSFYANAAEHKVCQQRKESGQNSNWSYSSGVMSVRDQVPPPLFGDKSGAAGELHAAIRAAYHVALHYKTTTLM
ncbi:hypothetical protein CTI12_AA238490 [Artemisia annua]|uniref:Uncharacterized protein n=1 Tax=Artemisia annua TaxID=35608 RepID=A0A2U1N2P1_ARTAN|nr:hypothetical protein CTI12_AA238490 [Artemisia annua]